MLRAPRLLPVVPSRNEPRSGDKHFTGRPDLVVEVLSPSTSRVDRKVKLSAYQKAGIPEYRLADPKTRSIVVYSAVSQRSTAVPGAYERRFAAVDSGSWSS